MSLWSAPQDKACESSLVHERHVWVEGLAAFRCPGVDAQPARPERPHIHLAQPWAAIRIMVDRLHELEGHVVNMATGECIHSRCRAWAELDTDSKYLAAPTADVEPWRDYPAGIGRYVNAENHRYIEPCTADYVNALETQLTTTRRELEAAQMSLGNIEQQNLGADLSAKLLMEIALTGEHRGTFGGPQLEAAAQAILALRQDLKDAEARLATVTAERTMEGLADDVHAFAVSKGWWEFPLEDRVMRLMRWLNEEVEEGTDAFIKTGLVEYTAPDDEGLMKPEGLPSELADLVLILFDLWKGSGVDLVGAMQRKLAYNKVRKYKRDAHGDALTPAPNTEVR